MKQVMIYNKRKKKKQDMKGLFIYLFMDTSYEVVV